MRLQKMKFALVGVALVAALGACGSSSKKAATPATTPTTLPPVTTTTTKPPNPYKATASPTTGLKDGDSVTVTVSGFKPGLSLGVNECSTTTDDTGSGCDLGGIQIIKSGADGGATATIKVKVGPFGKDKIVCTALKEPEHCLLSVGELTADPNAQRSDDVPLTFAG